MTLSPEMPIESRSLGTSTLYTNILKLFLNLSPTYSYKDLTCDCYQRVNHIQLFLVKLSLLHIQIAVKMLFLGKIWLIGTQESTDQMILQRLRIANMISYIQGNCHPECCLTNRGSYGLATNRKKKEIRKHFKHHFVYLI